MMMAKSMNIIIILLFIQIVIINNGNCEYENRYATKLPQLSDVSGFNMYFQRENKIIIQMKYEDLIINTRRLIRSRGYDDYQRNMKLKYFWAGMVSYLVARLGSGSPHIRIPHEITKFENDFERELNWTLKVAHPSDHDDGAKPWNYIFDYESSAPEEEWLREWRDFTNGVLQQKYDQKKENFGKIEASDFRRR